MALDVRSTIFPLVLGVVLIFVGAVSATIAGGIGQYVIGELNGSLGGGITINMLTDNLTSLMGTVFIMIGITLIVFAVAQMISALFQSMEPISKAVGA